MTYREAVSLGEKILTMAGIADVKTDAWMLLEMAAKIDRSFYYMHMNDEIPQEQLHEYEWAVKKRAEHIPLQYIVGETEFMGLPFKVNSNVLIPRQDTETLVEEALKLTKPGMKVLDMCTGSGCIAISLAVHGGYAHVEAADISTEALKVAGRNAEKLSADVRFRHSDMFSAFDGAEDQFDIIVSNPPYIPSDVIEELEPEVRDFEPRGALDGTADGLYFYEILARECGRYLKEDGAVYFEIGHDQGDAVKALLDANGFYDTKVIKDLAGNDRVVCGRWQTK